jgi:hypothetical protein
MKLTNLILSGGVAALITLVTPQAARAQCPAGENGAQFAQSKVQMLKPGFDFASNGGLYKGQYQPPQPDPNTSVNSVDTSIMPDIAAAFDGAPPFFQNELCGLSSVFIDPDRQGPVGWSFHEGQDQKNQNKTSDHGPWIGIWQGLWTEPRAQRPPLAVLETVELLSLLEINDFQGRHFKPHYQHFVPPGTPPNTWHMSLLAVLAHETAHWIVSRKDASNCSFNGANFFERTWSWWPGDQPRIHFFGDEVPGATRIDGSTKAELVSEVQGNPDQSLPKLTQVYSGNTTGNGHATWASLLAAMAPDEDFVETYTLLVLANAVTVAGGQTAPVTTLPIKVDPAKSPIDMIATNLQDSQSELYRKAMCIKSFYTAQPQRFNISVPP